ncbi:hypothetical protein G7Y89_g3508 [Cudoniella acicularis]|uniref:DUF2423 domain-containing protein n=1 Tax=Cudoniella acicularis TaxID=354080 RepID=A0A8H4RR88_9HELO|nr:hypothetical protein G7Y89_g3508 [Cudoniella acicularis]
MAKGARASVRKANNVRLKSQVFGPVENARMERLSAKLLELAAQPKPAKEDIAMYTEEGTTKDNGNDPAPESNQAEGMDIDQAASKDKIPSSSKKSRVEKRRRHSSRKAAIVFPKYKDGKRIGRTKAKK